MGARSDDESSGVCSVEDVEIAPLGAGVEVEPDEICESAGMPRPETSRRSDHADPGPLGKKDTTRHSSRRSTAKRTFARSLAQEGLQGLHEL